MSLEESKEVLDNIGKKKLPGPRNIEYETRDDIVETMKDLWNHEIAKGVNWLYSIGR